MSPSQVFTVLLSVGRQRYGWLSLSNLLVGTHGSQDGQTKQQTILILSCVAKVTYNIESSFSFLRILFFFLKNTW